MAKRIPRTIRLKQEELTLIINHMTVRGEGNFNYRNNAGIYSLGEGEQIEVLSVKEMNDGVSFLQGNYQATLHTELSEERLEKILKAGEVAINNICIG
jgi:hypothetical protein